MTIHFLTNKTNCAVNFPIFLVNVILWTFLNKISLNWSQAPPLTLFSIPPFSSLSRLSSSYPLLPVWTYIEREIHSCAYNHPWNYTPAFLSHKGRPHMWVLHMKPTFMLEEDVVTSAIRNTTHHTIHETSQLSQRAWWNQPIISAWRINASNCKFMTKAKQNNTIYLHKRSTNQNYKVSDM